LCSSDIFQLGFGNCLSQVSGMKKYSIAKAANAIAARNRKPEQRAGKWQGMD
jgi:hypothetical protein